MSTTRDQLVLQLAAAEARSQELSGAVETSLPQLQAALAAETADSGAATWWAAPEPAEPTGELAVVAVEERELVEHLAQAADGSRTLVAEQELRIYERLEQLELRRQRCEALLAKWRPEYRSIRRSVHY
jgi:hypothetical protein